MTPDDTELRDYLRAAAELLEESGSDLVLVHLLDCILDGIDAAQSLTGHPLVATITVELLTAARDTARYVHGLYPAIPTPQHLATRLDTNQGTLT